MDHDELVEAAKEAITKVFSDQRVARGDTRESLKELREEIDVMLDTLD